MKTTLVPFHRVFKDKTSGNKKFLSSEYLTHGKLAIVDQGQSTVAGFTDEIEASCKIKLPCVIFGDHTKKFQFQEKPFALGADGVKALEIARDVDPKYAYYAISLFRFPDGTGYSRHFKFLKEARVSLPDDIAEQRRIADILDKADGIRHKRQQSLKLIDDLVKSQFIEMFGDPVMNPKGWEIKKLSRMMDEGYIIYHLDGNHGGLYPKSSEFIEKGVPYIGANCIKNGEIEYNNAKYLSPERANQFRKGVAIHGDVLFAHNATVGPVALLKTSLPKIILSTSLTAYRCNLSLLNPFYLKAYMESAAFIRQYRGDMGQTTRNQVPITAQKKYMFILPPLSLQNEFARFVEQANKSKFTMQRQLSEIEILSSALKQKFFA